MTTPELQLVQTPVSSLRMDKVADINVIFSLDYMVLKAGAGAAADASQDLHSAVCTQQTQPASQPGPTCHGGQGRPRQVCKCLP